MLDLVIKDGVIADGTGKARFQGDVGVSGDRIVEVGKVTTPASRTVKADGLLITPGFVDIHTHFDGQVSWDAMLAPSCQHGVTSVAMGNCGVGFAPAKSDKHDWLIALLEGVEDIPGTALAEGLTWDWVSFPDYLNALDRRQFTVDVGAHLPHAALRTFVMGERGGDHTQHPDETEIAEMERLTYEALEAGALGFSTSRTFAHRTRSGENIGTLQASERELLGTVKALKRTGKGVVQMISDLYMSQDASYAANEVALVRKLAEASGRRLSISVQQSDDVPNRWREMMADIRAMSGEGLPVRAQVAPRPVGVIYSFASSSNPFMLSAAFREFLKFPLAERVAKLRDPAVKACVVEEHRKIECTGMMAVAVKGFHRMFRLTDPVDYEPAASSSLEAEAKRLGREVTEYAYDVFLEDEGRRVIYLPVLNYHEGNLDAVYDMLVDPNALFGLSDAGAHCGTISDGSFPTTTIALWSKGSRTGRRIPVENLIHGYTQRNAAHVGWMDRGVVAPGYLADLNVIDLDNLAVTQPKLTQDLPAGGARYLQDARGYKWTIKRGRVSFENGKSTGELAGRLQRGAQAAPRG